MNRNRLVAVLLSAMLMVFLVAPAAASAGGDQVNRPPASGVGAQQAGGDLPDWAPREEQSARP